jgi:hypothetical protein
MACSSRLPYIFSTLLYHISSLLSSENFFQKNQTFFAKPLDKWAKVCYNIDVEGERTKTTTPQKEKLK